MLCSASCESDMLEGLAPLFDPLFSEIGRASRRPLASQLRVRVMRRPHWWVCRVNSAESTAGSLGGLAANLRGGYTADQTLVGLTRQYSATSASLTTAR
jgi:hypothetical protein